MPRLMCCGKDISKYIFYLKRQKQNNNNNKKKTKKKNICIWSVCEVFYVSVNIVNDWFPDDIMSGLQVLVIGAEIPRITAHQTLPVITFYSVLLWCTGI